MSGLDLFALAVLAGSTALGLLRGLVKEASSLATWVLAFVGARIFGPLVAPLLPGVESQALRHALALVLVFIVVLIGGAVMGSLLSGAIRLMGLGSYDRLLGILFGLLRGSIALLTFTVIAGLTALPQTQTWKTAWCRPPLERAAHWVIPWLPRDVAALIKYS